MSAFVPATSQHLNLDEIRLLPIDAILEQLPAQVEAHRCSLEVQGSACRTLKKVSGETLVTTVNPQQIIKYRTQMDDMGYNLGN